MITTGQAIMTVWEIWTYDVWGNATDGFEVNDRYCHCRHHEMELDVEKHNVGSTSKFSSAHPTDKQIREALGITGKMKLDIDGDDLTIYVNRARDSYPIGELICTSHKSLSPIGISTELQRCIDDDEKRLADIGENDSNGIA